MANLELLFGPYIPPALKVGSRSFCLYRDCGVVVTSWTDARISWPRCRALHHRGGSGLLVTEELKRAILSESASALMHYFGIGVKAVWNWRRAFSVSQFGTPGSAKLHQAASERGVSRTKGKKRSANVRAKMRRAAAKRRPELLRLLREAQEKRWKDHGWTEEQRAMLGTMSDEDLAAKIGKTPSAVRAERWRRGIPIFKDGRRRSRKE